MIYYIVAHAPLFQTKNVPIQSLSPRSHFKIPPRGALKSVQQSWWAESPRSELAPLASPSVTRFQLARTSPNDYLNGYQKHLRSNRPWVWRIFSTSKGERSRRSRLCNKKTQRFSKKKTSPQPKTSPPVQTSSSNQSPKRDLSASETLLKSHLQLLFQSSAHDNDLWNHPHITG